MTDFYFANQVFVASVKDFEPYLSSSSSPSSVSKDDDLIASKAFRQVLAAYLDELKENDVELSDYLSERLA